MIHCIVDAPYGARVHSGHDNAVRETCGLDSERRAINYAHWSADDVEAFCTWWCGRCGWLVAMTSHDLWPVYDRCLSGNGRTTFAPLPAVIPGMTVRLGGDGPSSWCVWLHVSRATALAKWGTLPGAYRATPDRGGHIGGKPLRLMRDIIRDYSRPGDLIVDPCAGGGTTLLAAAIEGRRAIGAEMCEETYRKAVRRLSAGYTPAMTFDRKPKQKQEGLF